jgi:hypothetical protein
MKAMAAKIGDERKMAKIMAKAGIVKIINRKRKYRK